MKSKQDLKFHFIFRKVDEKRLKKVIRKAVYTKVVESSMETVDGDGEENWFRSPLGRRLRASFECPKTDCDSYNSDYQATQRLSDCQVHRISHTTHDIVTSETNSIRSQALDVTSQSMMNHGIACKCV